MFRFKSVKTKLASISALTIVGFSILLLLIIYFSNSQNRFINVQNNSKQLQNSIMQLEFISKQKIEDESFFQQYTKVISNFKTLSSSIEEANLESSHLHSLEKQLTQAEQSYQIVYDTQKKIDQYLDEMNRSKTMIKSIFEKVYEHKLIQYLMTLELLEVNFINQGTIDLQDFKITNMKLRRSVRASVHFSADTQIQKKVNTALMEYEKMLNNIVLEQKKIDQLQKKLNENFDTTTQTLQATNETILKNINQSSDQLLYMIIVISLIIVSLEFFIVTVVSKDILKNLHKVHNGLNSFFDVINYKSETAQEIQVNTTDEFLTIANNINENIRSSVELLNHNKEVLEEANDILQKVSNGFYGYKIPHHHNVSPDVKDLIININKMLDETKAKFEILNRALEAYGNYNFEHEIPKKDEKGLYGDFGSLVARTKLIGNNVSEFLAMIINTGEKLNSDTSTLNKSANELSQASNTQATSLEQTSASLEEVTQNILDNTNYTKKMAQYAQDLAQSSLNGKKLANETANAMDSITQQVTAINEAISVIDQIAFQTNILSLNAAVEAATAGEAGKGFAVVAGEVRNLASRSAEAANEIKALVEDASSKAHSGKTIASKMSQDYEELNKKVESTTQIIQNVSQASTKQHEHIKQINDTMSVLDQNTQINAQNSQYIADLSQSISSLSEDLISAAQRASFNSKVRSQVCDIELVYQTAKLKNDHLVLKSQSFADLGSYTDQTITDHSSCQMAKWIKTMESTHPKITQSTQWKELLKEHKNVHTAIQNYVSHNAKKASNQHLRELASTIETHTLALFDKLNEIKIVNCQ
jgi:methyl-accepting chemotaxis protein